MDCIAAPHPERSDEELDGHDTNKIPLARNRNPDRTHQAGQIVFPRKKDINNCTCMIDTSG